MKVLMIAIKFPPYFAGAGIQAAHLAGEFQQNGLEVEFFTDNDNRTSIKDTYKGLTVFRVRTFLTKLSKLKEAIYVTRILLHVLARPQFRIIHFHSIWGAECQLFPILKLLGKKVIVKLTLAESDDPLTLSRRKLLGGLNAWGLRFVDQFVCISTRLCELCYEAGIDRKRVRLVPNGVNLEDFYPLKTEERSRIKQKLGYAAYDKIFLSVGKIEDRKGYDFILWSWKTIQEQLSSAALLLVGPGNTDENSYYQELQTHIQVNGLRNVFFLGQVDNVDLLMQISDCFIFGSKQEGFGTVLIEAMAVGVPVVARNIEQVTEDIVTDARIGQICFSESAEEFATLALQSVANADKEGRLQAMNGVRQRFDIRYISKQYIVLYNELMGVATTTPKIRVLHIIKTLNLGGAEANLLNLALATNPAVAEVHIAYSLGGELEPRFRAAGTRLFRYSSKARKVKDLFSLIIIFRLWRYIRRNKIAIVHTHNFSGHVWGLIAAKLAGAKVVEHVHDHRYTPREEFLWRKGIGSQFKFTPYFKGRSDRVVVLTKQQQEYVLKKGYAAQGQVAMLQNGLPIENGWYPSKDVAAIRAELSIEPGRRIVVTTARIDEAKNIDLILRIAAQVVQIRPEVLFIISGDGPLLERYKVSCREMGLDHAVRFIGFHQQVHDLLAIADVFLLPTLLELHSIAILEAMMMRVPVVTSKGVGCNDEFLVSWQNGVLLDPFSDQGWAEAIIRLLEDDVLRRDLGERARATCIERFDIQKVAKRFEDLYVELCQN